MLSAVLFLALQQGTPTTPPPVKEDKPIRVIQGLDVVDMEYTGRLADGKQFDSSVGKPPFRFQVGVGAVIKGWDTGVLGLKEGDSKELVIPPDQGYGAQGAGDVIPPNATLKFDIKVIRIIPAAVVEVLKEGTGEGLTLKKGVEAQIRLTLKDGKKLTPDKEEPVTLGISPELPYGINQAIMGIKAGEKRKVTLNSDLMYGDKGVPNRDTPTGKAGSIIPGKSTLILEVEAIRIVNI
jgi:FKBP-type peptidyl-prolyl cis-trans isomerase